MIFRVELYGRLREVGLGEIVELELGKNPKAFEVLAALARRMGSKAELLQGAALATESEILASQAPVPGTGRLAALPPVCGG